MAGDPSPWGCNWPCWPQPVYPVYQSPIYTTWTGPAVCKWFEDTGNERFTYFTSCGAQIDQRHDWWKHCPKCGGPIEMPSDGA
jgi:hypothetical protein